MELPPEDGRKIPDIAREAQLFRLQWSYRPKTVESGATVGKKLVLHGASMELPPEDGRKS